MYQLKEKNTKRHAKKKKAKNPGLVAGFTEDRGIFY